VGLILAFAAGFFVGGRGGNEGLDEVLAAIRVVRDSNEFEDLLAALRSHASHTFRELADRLGSDTKEPITMSSVLDQARELFDRNAKGFAS
jgi:hypothetical protein